MAHPTPVSGRRLPPQREELSFFAKDLWICEFTEALRLKGKLSPGYLQVSIDKSFTSSWRLHLALPAVSRHSRSPNNELTTIATVGRFQAWWPAPTMSVRPLPTRPGWPMPSPPSMSLSISKRACSPGTVSTNWRHVANQRNQCACRYVQNSWTWSGGLASDSSDGHTTENTCGKLFYLANPGTAPTDTVTAMLNIAQHPSSTWPISTICSPQLRPSRRRWAWTPHRRTRRLPSTTQEGAWPNPQSIAVDASGNVWATNPDRLIA